MFSLRRYPFVNIRLQESSFSLRYVDFHLNDANRFLQQSCPTNSQIFGTLAFLPNTHTHAHTHTRESIKRFSRPLATPDDACACRLRFWCPLWSTHPFSLIGRRLEREDHSRGQNLLREPRHQEYHVGQAGGSRCYRWRHRCRRRGCGCVHRAYSFGEQHVGRLGQSPRELRFGRRC